MSINISEVTDNLNKLTLENYEEAGQAVASNFSNAEDLLMRAYSAKGSDELSSLAKELGIELDSASAKSSQLEVIQKVAQCKYEKSSRIYSMFSKIMENAHQMLMSAINKIG